jgi:cbb3-type cytochrome oxidase subunit 3
MLGWIKGRRSAGQKAAGELTQRLRAIDRIATPLSEVDALEEYWVKRWLWWKRWNYWNKLNRAYGFLMVTGNVVLASSIWADAPKLFNGVLSIAIGLLAGWYSFLTPATRARSYREAYLILDDALLAYKSGDPDMSFTKIRLARNQGEALISNVLPPDALRPPGESRAGQADRNELPS